MDPGNRVSWSVAGTKSMIPKDWIPIVVRISVPSCDHRFCHIADLPECILSKTEGKSR